MGRVYPRAKELGERRRAIGLRLVGVGLLATVLASACSEARPPSGADAPLNGSVPGPTVVDDVPSEVTNIVVTRPPLPSDADPDEETESAGVPLAGILVLRESCLFYDEDGYMMAVVWPHGSIWNEDSFSVVLPDLTEVRAGAEFRGTGVFAVADQLTPELQPYIVELDQCLAQVEEILLVLTVQ